MSRRVKPQIELRIKLGIELGINPGIELGIKPGIKPALCFGPRYNSLHESPHNFFLLNSRKNIGNFV